MVQKKLPLINSAHGSETRNIINELIKLFNGMGYTYDEALQKAHDVLSEAKRTNQLNNNTNTRLDKIIADSGTSSTEVVDARGGHVVLSERLDKTEDSLVRTSIKSDVNLVRSTRNAQDIESMVTFIDDDGYSELLGVLKPMFELRGVPCCAALRGDSEVLEKESDRQQLRDLQDNQEWEFLSHTMKHMRMNDATKEELEQDSKDFLELMSDYRLNVSSIAYPWGGEGDLSVVSKYYTAGFKAGPDDVNTGNMNDFRIARIVLGNANKTTQYYKDIIDAAVGKKQWVVFLTHVADSGTNVQQIEDVLDYAKEKLPIVNVKAGLKSYGSLVSTQEVSGLETRFLRLKPGGIIDTNSYLLNHVGSEHLDYGVVDNMPPSEYKIGITYATRTISTRGDWPTNGVMATIKYLNINGQSFQILYGSTAAGRPPVIYYRSSSVTNDSWEKWSVLHGVGPSISESTLPSECFLGETIQQASGTTNGNGTIKTIRVSADVAFARQIFYKALSNDVYSRFARSNDTWSDWVKIQTI